MVLDGHNPGVASRGGRAIDGFLVAEVLGGITDFELDVCRKRMDIG